MRKTILLSVIAICCLSAIVVGQTKDFKFSAMEESLNIMQSKQVNMDKELRQISVASVQNKKDIQNLTRRNADLQHHVDSLINICQSLGKVQEEDRETLNGQIQNTNSTVLSNQSSLINRTIWGGVIAITILASLLISFYYLIKRIKIGTSSISEVRKAQNVLQLAQTKMQEESIKLDNKMVELLERQMPSATTTNTEVDHSLALKVADEIVRIEMNLSHMDASIKGYKQLTKAVQRIKDNFKANGYEIVDMLGKPYNAGMKVVANFVIDEKLNFGQQIITGIIKPQINHNGQMIQAAQITISQNI